MTLTLAAGVAACGSGSQDSPSGRPAEGAVTPLTAAEGSPSTASWTPWPQALHDAQHSGAASVAGPTTDHVRWSRELEGNVTPGPVIAKDGTIYAASNAGVLHAIDPRNGKDRWVVDGGGSYGIDQSTSPAVLPDGLVLWPGPGGQLIAVAPAGVVAWRLDLGGQVTSPAVLADGSTTVGTSNGLLVGLRPDASGPRESWRVDLDEQSYGSPVFSPDGQRVYQSVVSGVVAVDEGTVVWHSPPLKMVEVSPAVAPDGTIVIGTNDAYEYGLSPGDGTVTWRHRRGFITYSSPVVTRDGIAYFGDHGNRITGVDATTGTEVFGFQGSRKDVNPGGIGIWTSVLVDADHSVYAGTRQGLIYGVDRTGRRMWQIEAGSTVDSYPALTADGALIIGTSDGRLLAIADS